MRRAKALIATHTPRDIFLIQIFYYTPAQKSIFYRGKMAAPLLRFFAPSLPRKKPTLLTVESAPDSRLRQRQAFADKQKQCKNFLLSASPNTPLIQGGFILKNPSPLNESIIIPQTFPLIYRRFTLPTPLALLVRREIPPPYLPLYMVDLPR